MQHIIVEKDSIHYKKYERDAQLERMKNKN